VSITKVAILQPTADKPERSTALEGVTTLLDEIGVSHDVVADLQKLFKKGKATVKVPPLHIDAIMKWVSRQQPEIRYIVQGKGEDQSTAWIHAYTNGEETVAKAPDKPKPKPTKAAAAAIEGMANAQPYSPKTTFATGDALEHPSFGKGVVLTAHADKILVQFLDQERTLVHGR
jgi:hypothetical protein